MDIHKILEDLKLGRISLEQAAEGIRSLYRTEPDYVKVDYSRPTRTGFPEVVYCEGKTVEQVRGIFGSMAEKGESILGTRASREKYQAVREILPDAIFYEASGLISMKQKDIGETASYIAVVAAGTSDYPVAEEAIETARFFGNKVEHSFDVGVAGIHRLFGKLDMIRGAKAIIVIAGMEGALASVVGGLVDKPVIAVPTSVGYGANFKGISALLAMLNSCAVGVSVVNIDNGFGAACIASMINKL